MNNFYFVYGDDYDMISKKYLPDIEDQYPQATWLRYDLSIDEIKIPELLMEYNSNNLFCDTKIFLFRNVEIKPAQAEDLLSSFLERPSSDNLVIAVGRTWNKTTKLGKLLKNNFQIKELSLPEIKPFDLLDSLNSKNTTRVIQQSNLLFTNDYNSLSLFSLISKHLLLMKQIKELEGNTADFIAKSTGQHIYRIKKLMPALNKWSKKNIGDALVGLQRLYSLLRTWNYDEKMLLQMYLIKICS